MSPDKVQSPSGDRFCETFRVMKLTDLPPPSPAGTPQRPLRSRKRLVVGAILAVSLLSLAILVMTGMFLFDRSSVNVQDRVALPGDFAGQTAVPALPGLPDDPSGEAESDTLRLSREEAERANSAIPVSSEKIVPARPFSIPASGALALSRQPALNCLTSAIYYEAAIESDQGQRAVAQVILNRMRHPAYPDNICDVVFQGSERSTGCQFTFTCDGSLARTPSQASWNRARKIATAALAGTVEPSVGTATHYHTNYVLPYWAKSLVKVNTIGTHIFYRWSGFWGRRAAFTSSYAGENLTGTEGGETGEDVEMAMDPDLDIPDETVTFVPEIDPILAPKFQAAPDNVAPAQAEAIEADRIPSPLAADRNRGTLILD